MITRAHTSLFHSPTFILSKQLHNIVLRYPTAGSRKRTYHSQQATTRSASSTPSAHQKHHTTSGTASAPSTQAMQVNTGTDKSATADHLLKLGEDVFLLEGEEPAKHDPEQPDVIVVFGWMDAEIRHIRKYADQYRRLLPTSKVLIVKSHSNFFWSNAEKKQAGIKPAVEYLDSQELTKRDASSGEKTLHLHTFSNGGSVQMTEIAKFLRARRLRQSTPGPSMKHSFPAESIVIDSAPGGNALRPLLSAFTAPIRSKLLKLLAYIPLTFGWAALVAFGALFRKPSPIDRLHKELVDSTLFPSSAERLYIYSKSDTIIKSGDVERNIASARQAGLKVSTEVYENSPHVSHARVDAKRYWSAVIALWKRALQESQKSI